MKLVKTDLKTLNGYRRDQIQDVFIELSSQKYYYLITDHNQPNRWMFGYCEKYSGFVQLLSGIRQKQDMLFIDCLKERLNNPDNLEI